MMMRDHHGITGLLYHRRTLMSGLTCSTGNLGLLIKMSGHIKKVGDMQLNAKLDTF